MKNNRYYNHFDLHQMGEEQTDSVWQDEAHYEPLYPCRIEKLALDFYHIFVEQPLFSNPVFENAFRKAYRVYYVKSRTPYQLVVLLNCLLYTSPSPRDS